MIHEWCVRKLDTICTMLIVLQYSRDFMYLADALVQNDLLYDAFQDLRFISMCENIKPMTFAPNELQELSRQPQGHLLIPKRCARRALSSNMLMNQILQ